MKKIFSALAICFCAGTLVAFSACQPTLKDPAGLYESFLNKESHENNFSSGETLDGTGTVEYRHVSTCEEFFEAVEANQNIRLINDITLAPAVGNENKASIITFSHEHNIYLHLNGFDITTEKLPDKSGRYYAFLNEGMLTVLGDGSTIFSRGIKNNGVLTIAGEVTVETNDTKGAAIVNNGSLRLQKGTIKSTKNGAICIENFGDAHLLGGSLQCANTDNYAITSYGNIEINGATITSVKGGVYTNAGDVVIENGSIAATAGYALAINGGRAVLNGGTLTGQEKDVLVTSSLAHFTINSGTITNGILNRGLVTLNNGATIDVTAITNAGGEVFDNRTNEE